MRSLTLFKKNGFQRPILAAIITPIIAVALAMNSGISATGASPQPRSGGTLVLLTSLSGMDDLDLAHFYLEKDHVFINSFITRTLVAYAPVPGQAGKQLIAETELTPDLATNTGVSSNQAKTWQFTLRRGTTFENGDAITCSDVKYGVSRSFAFDPAFRGSWPFVIEWLDIPKDVNGKSIYQGPYTVDPTGQAAFDKAVICDKTDRTITFNLNTSIGDFNNLASTGVMSPVQKALDPGMSYGLRPQATGPYKIESNTSGSLVLIRNGQWKQNSDPVRTPYPDRIELRFGIDAQVRDQILLDDSISNAVNYDNPLPQNRSMFFEPTTGAPIPAMAERAINHTNTFVYYLAFNLKKMPCLEIRQAMYYARDAKANLDNAGGPAFQGSYATGIISPVLTADYAPSGIAGPGSPNFLPSGDIPKAIALLEIARTKCPTEYQHATVDGIVIDISPGQLTRQDTIPNNVAAFARAGIKVSYNLITSGYYGQVTNPTIQSDLSNIGWGADWPNASVVIPYLYISNRLFNLSRNGDDPNYQTFAADVTKAVSMTNRQQQGKLWKELDKRAVSYFWILPNRYGKSQFVWGSGVGGVSLLASHGSLGFGKMWIK